jgi:DNA-binding response OmpR family regulator
LNRDFTDYLTKPIRVRELAVALEVWGWSCSGVTAR